MPGAYLKPILVIVLPILFFDTHSGVNTVVKIQITLRMVIRTIANKYASKNNLIIMSISNASIYITNLVKTLHNPCLVMKNEINQQVKVVAEFIGVMKV